MCKEEPLYQGGPTGVCTSFLTGESEPYSYLHASEYVAGTFGATRPRPQANLSFGFGRGLEFVQEALTRKRLLTQSVRVCMHLCIICVPFLFELGCSDAGAAAVHRPAAVLSAQNFRGHRAKAWPMRAVQALLDTATHFGGTRWMVFVAGFDLSRLQ